MSKHSVPDTSKAAYESIKGEMQENHHAKILAALNAVEYAIYEEIAVSTGLEKHAVGRRLLELELAGKVYKTGIKKPTSTRRQAYAYSVVGKEIPKAKEKPKKIKKVKSPPPNQNVIIVSEYVRQKRKTIPNSTIIQNHLF
jgi:hypothetical protein